MSLLITSLWADLLHKIGLNGIISINQIRIHAEIQLFTKTKIFPIVLFNQDALSLSINHYNINTALKRAIVHAPPIHRIYNRIGAGSHY